MEAQRLAYGNDAEPPPAVLAALNEAEAAAEAMIRQHNRRLTAVPPPGKGDHILGHLIPGEPFFVFRAKDILSTFALDEYAKLVEKFNPDSPQLVSLVDSINSFRSWQIDNPSEVKLPD